MIGRSLGRAVYYKNKGEVWLAPIRQWILPALGGSAALKYLGFGATHAVLLMAGVAVVWEVAAIVIGWVEHRSGATQAHYEQAALTDPFRRGSLEKLDKINDILWEIHNRLDRIDTVTWAANQYGWPRGK